MMLILTTTGYADFQFIFNDHTYQVITTSSSWEAASAAARSKTVNGVQGYLAHIDNLQENTAIFDQLMANISSNDFGNTSAGSEGGGAAYVWIGANDISTEGKWVWVDDGTQFWQGGTDGSSVDGRFSNWPRGFEPDNWREQDAAGITLTGFPLDIPPWGAPGQWNDVDINNNLYYVVEFDTGNTFEINAGLNDAWFNLATAGQGFLISVFPDRKEMFVAWFTFDTERPPEDVTAMLGDPGHRWLTASGGYAGDTATLDVFLSTGGVFDSPVPPVTTGPDPVGTMVIKWNSCNSAVLTYDLPTFGVMGEIPIERIVGTYIPLCEQAQP